MVEAEREDVPVDGLIVVPDASIYAGEIHRLPVDEDCVEGLDRSDVGVEDDNSEHTT